MAHGESKSYTMNPTSNYDFHGLIDILETFAEYEKIRIHITPVVDGEDE